MTKVFVITVKGFKHATSFVRYQDAITSPARHMWETGSSNWLQFMLQWFMWLPEFPFHLVKLHCLLFSRSGWVNISRPTPRLENGSESVNSKIFLNVSQHIQRQPSDQNERSCWSSMKFIPNHVLRLHNKCCAGWKLYVLSQLLNNQVRLKTNKLFTYNEINCLCFTGLTFRILRLFSHVK